MNIRLGDTHTIRWTTTNPSTGAAADASSQTVSVYEESTDAAIVNPSATNVSTGHYRADIVATVGNGFEAGKVYNVGVDATIGGVACKGIILTFKVDAIDIDDIILASGTAQSGGANYIQLAAAEVSDVRYLGQIVAIYSGTGVGQSRMIIWYDSSTKTAYVRPWTVNPDSSSRYAIHPSDDVKIIASSRINVVTSQVQFTVQTAGMPQNSSALNGVAIVVFTANGIAVGQVSGYSYATGIITLHANIGSTLASGDPCIFLNDVADVEAYRGAAIVAADGNGAIRAHVWSMQNAVIGSSQLDSTAIDVIWDEVMEGGYTGRQLMKLLAAALLGKTSGWGTASVVFRASDDSKDRITAVVDVDGNRTSITLDPA